MNRRELDHYAAQLGLTIARYNPGDNPRWKIAVGRDPVDYHALPREPVYRTLREVEAFLDGFRTAKGG